MKNIFKFTFVVFYLQTLFDYVASQEDIKELILSTYEVGKIEQDAGYNYFYLDIPSGTLSGIYNLIFTIKQDPAAGHEEFSDPDIYVSKTNTRPNSSLNSTWYSERFGEDLLTISNSYVQENDKFYIGVFCQYKCTYELFATFELEAPIDVGSFYRLFVQKGKDLSFRLKTIEDFNELDIVAFSPRFSLFRVFLSAEEEPSSQNTLTMIPIGLSGYSANIQKNSPGYCSGCEYKIVIQATHEDAQLFFFAKYEDTVTKIQNEWPIMSALRPKSKHCYMFNVDDQHGNENVIIQTIMFTGSSYLKFKMGDSPDFNDSSDDKNYFDIVSERFIKVTPHMRSKSGSGDLYVCLTSEEFSSYALKVLYEGEVESNQRLNMLIPGKEISGYLPAYKATRYRVLEFNALSDIAITLKTNSGKPQLYGFTCEQIRHCRFDYQRVQSEKANFKKSEMISGVQTIKIPTAENICHQKLSKEDTLANEINSIPCAIVAIIACEGSEECEFNLFLKASDTVKTLVPKKAHFQAIGLGITDTYSIEIKDLNATKLNVILNTISGDADLSVEYFDIDYKNFKKISTNEPYLPDVIQIKKEELKDLFSQNYVVKVYGSSFSSYSIYYYLSYDDQIKKPGTSITTMNLEKGHLLKDIYNIDEKFKVYSYTDTSYTDKDIRITLTAEGYDFFMYVYTDLDNLVYNTGNYTSNPEKKFEGWKWANVYSDQLVITKSDPNYVKRGTYYIVITGGFNYANYSDHTPWYWIGVTDEETPFLLFEGTPHLVQLDPSYKSQQYIYSHSDTENPLILSLNIFYGSVNLYVDFKPINDTQSKSLQVSELNIDTRTITISSDVIKSNCRNSNCDIHIKIVKNSDHDTQYVIVAKSHPSKPEVLSAGIVRYDKMLAGETRTYSIFTDKSNSNMLLVSFLNGFGDVYINIPKESRAKNKATYPTEKEFDYKGEDFYVGKLINLSDKPLFKDCDPCQILVSVISKSLGYAQNDIAYSVSFYNQERKINQNQPLRSYIGKGEIQIFNMFFGIKAENVYLSLTNLSGDVDMFVNYGLDVPIFNNATWVSATPYNEFIDFDKDDNYFTTRNMTDTSGNYTVLLYGVSNSSYTLYVTSHPKKITPVSTGAPASCKGDAQEPCLFRYNDFVGNSSQDYDIIITTDYLYGLGEIYVSLYEENGYEIIKNFPSKTKYDYSNINSNSRNMLKIKIDKTHTKLQNSSMLLISVECHNKCFFDLFVSQMFNSDVKFLDVNRENVLYLYKSVSKTVLIFYNWSTKNINIAAHSYEGSAKFKAYLNRTDYQSYSKPVITDLTSFSLSNSEDTYHGLLTSNSLSYQNIYFEVEPLTDTAFYIRLTNDQDWTKIGLNKINSYVQYSNNFYGYFDLLDEYSNILLNIKAYDSSVVYQIYVKYLLIEKTYSSDSPSSTGNYDVPNLANAHLSGATDLILNSVSIKIPKLSDDQIKGVFTRVLVTVEPVRIKHFEESTSKFDILVTTNTDGMSIINAEQEKLIFFELENDKDYKVFDLKRKDQSDQQLVIEMSSCMGDFEYKLCNKIINNRKDACSLSHNFEIYDGKKVIVLDLVENDYENFYLSVGFDSKSGRDCYKNKEKKISCADKTEATLFYFTTTLEKYQSSFAMNKGVLSWDNIDSNSVKLKWGKLLATDEQNQMLAEAAEYFVFISNKEIDYLHMDSICYLSRMRAKLENVEITFKNRNNTAIISNLESGRKYYVNVMAKNIKNNQIIAYRPIEINFESTGMPTSFVVLLILAITVLVFLVVFFYKKFKVTKEILEYETNDIRNIANIPKSETELKNVIQQAKKQKYANLNDDTALSHIQV